MVSHGLLDAMMRTFQLSVLEIATYAVLSFCAGAFTVIMAALFLDLGRFYPDGRDLEMVRHLRDREGKAVNN